MNFLLKSYCAIHRFVSRTFLNFSTYREAKFFDGEDSLSNIPDILSRYRRFRPLIIVDSNIAKLEAEKKVTSILKKKKISYFVLPIIKSNPTLECCSDCYETYKNENCDCIIALGGGSTIDAAKAVGAKVSNPKKEFTELKGYDKVKKTIPLTIAIPTMAGSGNESTGKAVITNEKSNEKIVIMDDHMIPHFVILDASFLNTLPKDYIAYSGMDVLVNSVEVFIGISTKKAKEQALKAAALVKNNLVEFYSDKDNKLAKVNMQKASYLSGLAITEGGVGYANALTSSISTKYKVPHGLVNAILLPYVLKAYGKKVYKSLAQISDYLGFVNSSDSKKDKATILIQWIEDLNHKLGIPAKLLGIIKDEDILGICSKASNEANPLYPVPATLGVEELEVILLLATK